MKKKRNPLEIDIYHLHEECRKQARLYKEWSDAYANSLKMVSEAKSNFELVEAKLRLRINQSPSKYGLDKTTAPLIDAAVLTQTKYQDAAKLLHQAKHDSDVLKGMVDALRQKKDMIESEVQLSLAGYFAEPRIKTTDVGEMVKNRVRKPLKKFKFSQGVGGD